MRKCQTLVGLWSARRSCKFSGVVIEQGKWHCMRHSEEGIARTKVRLDLRKSNERERMTRRSRDYYRKEALAAILGTLMEGNPITEEMRQDARVLKTGFGSYAAEALAAS